MISNYIKIAWRSIWKHKAYSIINIVGLSIGLTACLIVATVVFDELSYDQQWTKKNDIYRILTASKNVKGETMQPVSIASLGPSLKKDFPEVLDYCRMRVQEDHFKFGSDKQDISIRYLDAEESVWNFLDFTIIRGNPKNIIKGYKNIIISQNLAKQYFNDINPVGKLITSVPQFGKPENYIITGVIANIPRNTHLRADAIIIADYPPGYDVMPAKMGGTSFLTQYILLKPGTSMAAFTNKVNSAYAKLTDAMVSDYMHQFQPVKDVYLRSDFADGEVHGSIRAVYIFAGVAALLLIIACINFVNLTISRVFNRAKETGIRKVLGAEKLQLIIRFLTESLLFFIIAFTVALILYPLFIKPVQAYLGHQLVLNIYNLSFLMLTVVSVFLVSLLTGLYPAWYLSRPKPVVILRNNIAGGVQLNVLKKVLVVGQFVISVSVILVTLIVHNQLDYISKKNLGFDKNNLLNIGFSDWGTKGEDFKKSIKRLPGVENASLSQWWPAGGSGTSSTEMELPGQKEKVTVNYIWGDVDLASTLKLKIRSGRMLNPTLATDAVNRDSIFDPGTVEAKELIRKQPMLATNYTAALLGLTINQPVKSGNGIPVGIIDDFNSESLHDKLKPTFIEAINNVTAGNLLIRVKPGAEKAVLIAVDKLYKSYYPNNVLKYDWIDNLIDQQYQTEH